MNLRTEQPLVNSAQAVRRFCVLLENDPPDPEFWLKDVQGALAALYSAAFELPNYGLPEDAVEPADEFDVTDERYRHIVRRLQSLLNDRSAYWTYFDPTITNDPTEKPVVGMLWDDLADIYRDVRPGLTVWDTERDELLHHIAFDWKWPLFETHWGLHAVDAMRALHWWVSQHGFTGAPPATTVH